ncbi:protein kinase [Trypanosoma conorhini]|uniref:Protein kinase n=1 Tax=Trypanosoma conorhini TaxID=83891 RepID=A0A3S5ITU5_9TRYP|nr:protein kinase [Trypanosoma conorhini]RNF23503.1 protein kinase [Trypanosoma conorhini]
MTNSKSEPASASDADAVLIPQKGSTVVGPGVVPLLHIPDAIRHYTPQHESRWGFSPIMSSITSPGDSNSGTARCRISGSLRGMLDTTLEVPGRLIIPLERLRVLRGAVLGAGSFGEVLRGELSLLVPAARQGPAPSRVSFPRLSAQSCSNAATGHPVSVVELFGEEEQPSAARSTVSGTSSISPDALMQPDPCSPASTERLTLQPSPPLIASPAMPPSLKPLTTSSPPLQPHLNRLLRDIVCLQAPLSDDAFTEDSSSLLRPFLRPATSRAEVGGASTAWKDRASAAADGGVIVRPVAVKRIDKSRLRRWPKMLKSFGSELKLTASLRHPCIVRVYGAAEDDAELYLVMEHVLGDTLEQHIKTHRPERTALLAPRFLADVVLALEYLHAAGVVHRDVKPCNLLVTEDKHVVLVDFGCACYLSDLAANSFAGSPAYISPEMLRVSRASATSDLWALGCVLFELFAGSSPFQAETPVFVMRKIKDYRDGELEFPPRFPAAAKDLVGRLLRREPTHRLGADELGGFKELKAHPFFAGVDWRQAPKKSNLTFLAGDTSLELQPGVLGDGEGVVHCSLVRKEGSNMLRRMSGRRLLVLTDLPRLFFVELSTRTVKHTIPVTADLHARATSADFFRAVTKERNYVFRDLSGHASRWATCVNDMVSRLYRVSSRSAATTNLKSGNSGKAGGHRSSA